jgi:hypothetical protein
MTTRSVQNSIRIATQDPFLTKHEAKAIVKEAEKGVVTAGEAKAIADLFDSTNAQGAPGLCMGPDIVGVTLIESKAVPVLEAFFAKHNVPAGAQKKVIEERAHALLANVEQQEPLAAEPKLRGLFPLALSQGSMADAPADTAYVDLKKGALYLMRGASMAHPTTRFWGPFTIQQDDPAVCRFPTPP